MQTRMIMTCERLDRLSKTYRSGNVGALLGVKFFEYVRDPEEYDRLAAALRSGCGLRRCESDGRWEIIPFAQKRTRRCRQ